MILAVAATQFEMQPFLAAVGVDRCQTLISGVGPVESCLRLAAFFSGQRSRAITAVVNFGVGGAYGGAEGRDASLQLLDICLAQSEVLGDLGICFPRRIDDLPPQATAPKHFELDPLLLEQTSRILEEEKIPFHTGNFVTLSCASGTTERGEMLQTRYRGLCENMEGGAVARVCREFGLPLLELRCISNFVEDRNTANWRLQQAADTCATTAALVVNTLAERVHTS